MKRPLELLLFALALTSCKKSDFEGPLMSPSPSPEPRQPVTTVDAGTPSSLPPPSWHVAAHAGSLCFFASSRGNFCLNPKLRADDKDFNAWLPRRRASSEGVVELAAHGHCFRDEGGKAHCDGAPVVPEVRSVVAYPYGLKEDGTVIDITVVEEHRKDGLVRRLRGEFLAKLPKLKAVAALHEGACAITTKGEVTCWTEPQFHFDEETARPPVLLPVAIPKGTATVEEIFVQPWLTLCARTSDGVVFCSQKTDEVTEACALRGNDVRCGKLPKSGRAGVVGQGYDARRALTRPLVRVPGVEAVKRFAPYPSKIYYGNSEIKASTISEWEEGGCALLGDGSVRCWERDFCTKGATWRSANVEALPKVVDLGLGAEDGYAIDERGLVHTWPRPNDRSAGVCPSAALAPKARVTTLPRAKSLGGGVVVVEAEPMTVAVDCAVLETNNVVCWRGQEELDARPVPVTLPP